MKYLFKKCTQLNKFLFYFALWLITLLPVVIFTIIDFIIFIIEELNEKLLKKLVDSWKEFYE
jgi:hypothetical protein